MRLLIVTQKVDKNDDILGFFHGWIIEFAKYCESVIVICLQKGEYDLPANVRVLSLGKEEGGFWLKYSWRFYKYIWSERKNYDTVFVHMNAEYVILGGLDWKIMGKKISLWYTHKAISWKLFLAERLTDIIFTASPESFRLRSRKVKVLGHGIDIERFNPQNQVSGNLREQGLNIITIGRISPIKDYETLIEAVEILLKKGIDLNLKIVGAAPIKEQEKYLASLKAMVKEKNLGEQVLFLGSMPNNQIEQHLLSSDIFVHASHTGSLDKAILEAMACELPVLSCNESLAEVFGAYKNKLMFNKKDAGDLAKKLEDIIGISESEKKELGRNLRQIVALHHNLKDLIGKIIKELNG